MASVKNEIISQWKEAARELKLNKNATSKLVDILKGVSQGSILGPI